MTEPAQRIAVIGGGISGLSAAWELSGAVDPSQTQLVVLESDRRWGGKIDSFEFEGSQVDLGPDAFLARRPEAVGLCQELGIEAELVAPSASRAYVCSRGKLRALPSGLVLGVPTRFLPVASSGILPWPGLLRLAMDFIAISPRTSLPKSVGGSQRSQDCSVGDIIRTHMGSQVLDRLVDPLVGGIHAGRAARLSAAATFPQLLQACATGPSLARNLRPPGTPDRAEKPTQPIFLSVQRGLSYLIESLVAQLLSRGISLQLSTTVRSLGRSDGRWVIGLEEADLQADGVVLAVPAPVSASLLASHSAQAASLLGSLEHASVAIVTLAYAKEDVATDLSGTGFVVPAVEGRLLSACTWLSSKWKHLEKHDEVLLRASVGRFGDERFMALDDEELLSAAHAELSEMLDLSGPPLAGNVRRWPGAFPQYAVGHLELVSQLQDSISELRGLALAGAALNGVGIPACIASARAAARKVLADQLRR
ncbi:MAG: protoporphyrinogen oxidase [Actinobacteria bacterium]|nr:protoporphyrinogen oxidase [Actinomycetota bacterium]